MGISTDRNWRQQLIFFSILLMLAALFTSRALLSVGMIVFLLLTCFHKNFAAQLRDCFSSRLLFGIILLFLIPCITWFWSEDKHEWARWSRIKLPLLLLPVGFAGSWQLTSRQWTLIAYFFLFLVFCGCCWSLLQYIQDAEQIHSSYLKAKIMATPLGNDHVRFSLLVCLAVMTASILFLRIAQKTIRLLLTGIIIFFIIYLHVLSARTGLFSLYIFLIPALIYIPMALKRKKWIPFICLTVLMMPVAAWFLLPTFQNRIKYFIYDFSFVTDDDYLPGSNDGSRVTSLKAGWNILVNHPYGVGSGDVAAKTKQWYSINQPEMLSTEIIYPSSEWLMYGAAAGWAGFFLFTLIMLVPFFEKIKGQHFFWIMLNIVMAFSLVFDIGLEAQFGVFIYAFFILGAWKVNRKPKT